MVHANARLTPAGRLILVRRIQAGRPAAHVAAEMGISRTTAYRWWTRYRQEGIAGLQDRPSNAHTHPNQTPAGLEQAIATLRRTRKLGPARIAAILGLVTSTVHRVLVRLGLNRLAILDRPTGQQIRRYERAAPGELVHLDVNKLGRLRPGGGHRVHGRDSAQHRTRDRSPHARPGYDYLHDYCTPPSTTTPGWPTSKSCPMSEAPPARASSAALASGSPATASPSGRS